MPESNMSLPASDIDKALVIGTLETAAIADADYLEFYDVSESSEQPQKKTTFGELKAAITGGAPQLPTATPSDYGRGIIVQTDGSFGLGASAVPIFENFVVMASEWQEDSSVSPFSYSINKSASAALLTDDTVELINNDPYVFAKYGINLDARGSTLKFLAVEAPTELVVLRCRIWRNQ